MDLFNAKCLSGFKCASSKCKDCLRTTKVYIDNGVKYGVVMHSGPGYVCPCFLKDGSLAAVCVHVRGSVCVCVCVCVCALCVCVCVVCV